MEKVWPMNILEIKNLFYKYDENTWQYIYWSKKGETIGIVDQVIGKSIFNIIAGLLKLWEIMYDRSLK